jgi:SNF2 family DNA or RNA helicase
MLKNKDNQVYKALMKIKTNRRICLSGTPFVNNLLEYYRMVSYIRPNLLGDSERYFQNEYINPIEAGMASDAEHSVKISADERLTELFQTLQVSLTYLFRTITFSWMKYHFMLTNVN